MQNSSTYYIRPMRENDVEQVSRLEQKCFSIPWTRGMLQEELENMNAVYLVADQEADILGYCGAWRVFSEGHITNVAVSPDRRRQGIARKLLLVLMETLAGAGVTAVTLEVRRGNNEAIELYNSLGFSVEGIRRKYYADNNEDALIMWRKFE